MKFSIACKRRYRAQHKQHGTILPVLLMLLVIISLLIAGVLSITEQQTNRIIRQQQVLNAQTELHNTLEILRYSLSTRPFNYNGMVTDLSVRRNTNPFSPYPTVRDTEVRFDNTLYRGWGESRFALQDADSLLNLNEANPKHLAGLLTQLNPTDTGQEALIAALNTHKQAAHPDPALNPLASVAELGLLPVWQETELLTEPLFRDAVSTIGRNFFNVNTSPDSVVKAYTQLNEQELAAFIRGRPYQDSSQVYAVTARDRLPAIETLVYVASHHFRLRLYHPDLNYYEELFISFSLKEEDGHPWIIESALRLPAAGAPDPETAQETGLRFFDPAYLEFYTPF